MDLRFEFYKTKNYMKPELITEEFASTLFDTYDRKTHKYAPIGLFYYNVEGTWIAIDNSTGDAWTEQFESLEGAIVCLNKSRTENYGYLTYCDKGDLNLPRGENARRMLEIGILQDELVKLGFEHHGEYLSCLFLPSKKLMVDFQVTAIVLVWQNLLLSYKSPTWQQDVLIKIKELMQ